MKELLIKLNYIRTILAYPFLDKRKISKEDWERWKDIYGISSYSNLKAINILNFKFKEFSNILIYRQANTLKKIILMLLLKREKSLWISCNDIGGGFVVYHGNSTRIYAKKIGNNFSIYQNVTIGGVNSQIPIIGDNVEITTSAVVIGGISIGDNSIIGANSTVTKNIPSNCTVVGGSSRIVKENGEKVNKIL